MTTDHALQSHSNTCIAACVSMVLSHLDQPCSEADLIQRWGPPDSRGYSLKRLQDIPGVFRTVFDLNDPAGFAQLEGYLRRQWVVATMFTGPMTVFASEYNPPLESPYGRLVTLYQDKESLMNHGRESHAVVLTERSSRGVRLYDPYHLGLIPPELVANKNKCSFEQN